jgi:hypothetical protein
MSDNPRANTLGGPTRMNTPNPYAPRRANVYDVNDAGEQVLADRATRFVAASSMGLFSAPWCICRPASSVSAPASSPGLVDALMIFGEPRRCIHDKLADTIVIKA